MSKKFIFSIMAPAPILNFIELVFSFFCLRAYKQKLIL